MKRWTFGYITKTDEPTEAIFVQLDQRKQRTKYDGYLLNQQKQQTI